MTNELVYNLSSEASDFLDSHAVFQDEMITVEAWSL